MTDLEKPKDARPESPTTAKALDFDDDTAPPSPSTKTALPNTGSQAASTEETAPPKPPRPLSPQQQAENTLKEAFPSIDGAVVKAVLMASGGQVEPAFNALLGMSDPDAAEPAPPPQPPRRQQAPLPATPSAQDQLAADERYARQLAEHYNGVDAHGFAPQRRYSQQDRQRRSTEEDDKDYNFFDDDLPVIKENIKRGFLDTQTTVNRWVTNLKKKIDGEDEDEFANNTATSAQGFTNQNSYGGRRSSDHARRSMDRDRYDADPQVLGDDFAALQMRDNENLPERRSSRPATNPNLFKPTPARPQSGSSGRRVSFQEGPPEEIDIHYPRTNSPSSRATPTSAVKTSKWQPLAAVEPSPVAEHDPFSLGDSDEDEAKKKDAKPEDSARLKQAAAEAMADDIGGGTDKTVEPSTKEEDKKDVPEDKKT